MKKLGLLVFAIAIVGSLASVWAITGKTFAVPSFAFFKQIKGSGNIVKEKRDITDFTGVSASGAMQIEITAGKEFSVELEGDDNILPLIETSVRGGVLSFERKSRRIKPSGALIARITMPSLEKFKTSGATNATIVGVASEDLKIEASGASKIEIAGATRELDVDVSGAVKLNAENLQATNVRIEASGASKVYVFAAEAVNADASGASRVVYSGNPQTVAKDASGASSITAK